jgi:PilZ domain
MELRQHKRYRLAALVNFEWESNGGTIHHGEGQTRDISPAGVFVIAMHPLSVGTAVRLEVDLPGLRAEISGPRLKTHAHVIRSERTGFAAIADAGFRLQIQDVDSSRKSTKDDNGEQLVRRVEVLHH